jgi:gamma-glutamyl hercynylcysteine S-oxide synthase
VFHLDRSYIQLILVLNLLMPGLTAQVALAQKADSTGDFRPERQALNAFITALPATDRLEFEVNGTVFRSYSGNSPLQLFFAHTLSGWSVAFKNQSKDTLTLSNVVPFGRSNEYPYITGKGDHPLSRSHLFMPGKSPVNVILPDNAWELGYASRPWPGHGSVYGLARRKVESIQNGRRKRFETILYPGGQVTYNLYFDSYEGEWQNGLRKAFNEHKLYDVLAEKFDRSLFDRNDLQWINKAYIIHLMMAWDKEIYDPSVGKYVLPAFVERGTKLYGGDDMICLWPTWPTLGIDQRNQFDLYRDLPGGLKALENLSKDLNKRGSKFFIAYNPWDESTRKEDHLKGLTELIRATNADGVVLDTKGESSKELQQSADDAKAGVVMYSEGMAVPKDMVGIVAGRVHNALYYPPMLNLNKLIMPGFAIFRVAEVNKERIQREYALSFFNGYGTEINQFAPGHPSWELEQYKYLGRTTRILRENSDVFTRGKLTPLIATKHDSIWVNRWESKEKTIYTIFSLKPEGFNDWLFDAEGEEDYHFVDLWKHEEVITSHDDKQAAIKVNTDSFNREWLGTNNEGDVSCIARLPRVLQTSVQDWKLSVKASRGTKIRIWSDEPAYDHLSLDLTVGDTLVDVVKLFGRFEGKVVVQLFESDALLDENVLDIKSGIPRLISRPERSSSTDISPGMKLIPAGMFVFKPTHGDEFIYYPDEKESSYSMSSFYMDQYPVTNKDFYEFVSKSGYTPADTVNYLKHWKGGRPLKSEEQFPVVYISHEDAMAYAKWAKKRLPTEIEWQYAAQTTARNEWPWKQDNPVTRKEVVVNETLTVSSIQGIDKGMCNLGDGKLYPVGKYRKGVNPNGLYDLTGCVWQLTADVYQSGSYSYIMMKGGSNYKPSSSWWYVQGGPRELHYRQYLLRVSEGFERNATVGFRCVRDLK